PSNRHRGHGARQRGRNRQLRSGSQSVHDRSDDGASTRLGGAAEEDPARIECVCMKSLKRFFLAALVTTAATITVAQERAPQVRGIDTAGMDLSVRPQDDSFRY